MAGELGNPSQASGRAARAERATNGAAGKGKPAETQTSSTLHRRQFPEEPRERLSGDARRKAIADLINEAQGDGAGGARSRARGQEPHEEDEGGEGEGEGERLPGRLERRKAREQNEPGAGGEGDAEGEGGEGAGEPGGEGAGEGEEGITLEELGEALEIPKKELNALTLKVGETSMTVGELKELIPRLAKLDRERAEFDEERTVRQLEAIDAHRQILALVDTLPARSLPPALFRELEAQQERTRVRESALLHKARPQWGDPKYAAAERSAMAKIGKLYGFSEAELGSILDHRQVLLLQDFARAKTQIDQARGAARKVEPAGDKRLTPESAKGPQRRDSRGRPLSKRAELSQRIHDLISRG